jgi:hypothetical protein
MNYQKIYNKLVEYRQQYPATGYVERHHIVPRSMGGSDEAANLVVLTGREHWVAHLLLWKVYRNSQTIQACHMMAMRCKVRGIPKVRSSRMYETLRIEHSKLVSERHKITQHGKGNSQYGTCWICNLALQQNKKISKDEAIPDGWIIGRNIWNKKERNLKKQNLKEKKIETYLLAEGSIIQNTEMLWNEYIKSQMSLRKFYKTLNVKICFRALLRRFEKYIPEYKTKIIRSFRKTSTP